MNSDEPFIEHVTVAGGSLWTESFGRGLPVVLAHGGPGLSNNLESVGGMIEDIARVHLYDQRGAGRSSSGGPFDVATFVADLDALREHWGYDWWVVGGHSWGAALALFYALAHPERTLGVVYLSGTAVHPGFQERVRAERMRRLTMAERISVSALTERLKVSDNERDRSQLLRLLWSTDFASREAARVLDSAPLYEFPRSEAVARAVQADWMARLDDGIEEPIHGLRCPVLVLHGAEDPDPLGAREVAELAPLGEWSPIADAGHSPWLEQPEVVRERLRAFLGPLQAG